MELAVSTTGYTIDDSFWLNQHIEGEYLFRDTLTLKLTLTPEGFRLRYLSSDDNWSENLGRLVEPEGDQYLIPLASSKGFRGQLRLNVSRSS